MHFTVKVLILGLYVIQHIMLTLLLGVLFISIQQIFLDVKSLFEKLLKGCAPVKGNRERDKII